MITLSIMMLAAAVATGNQRPSALCAPGASACELNWGTLGKKTSEESLGRSTEPAPTMVKTRGATPTAVVPPTVDSTSSRSSSNKEIVSDTTPKTKTSSSASKAASEKTDTTKRTVRRSSIRIPVSPKDDYVQPTRAKTDTIFIPSPAAVSTSYTVKKPSWWMSNKKWAKPVAIGLGVVAGAFTVKCLAGGLGCGGTQEVNVGVNVWQ
jgi:hypothetical protein